MYFCSEGQQQQQKKKGLVMPERQVAAAGP
jgi:hypothetical protein